MGLSGRRKQSDADEPPAGPPCSSCGLPLTSTLIDRQPTDDGKDLLFARSLPVLLCPMCDMTPLDPGVEDLLDDLRKP
jgi:hypothetical protein